jgi:hypothetical protein
MAVKNCWVEDTALPLHWAGVLPDSQSPIVADGGTVMSNPATTHCRQGGQY